MLSTLPVRASVTYVRAKWSPCTARDIDAIDCYNVSCPAAIRWINVCEVMVTFRTVSDCFASLVYGSSILKIDWCSELERFYSLILVLCFILFASCMKHVYEHFRGDCKCSCRALYTPCSKHLFFSFNLVLLLWANQLIDWSIDGSINQTINWLIDQSIDRSIDRSINRSMD